MFSFLTTKNSVEAAPYIRQVIDLTTPNQPRCQEGRRELRYNRSFPVTVCPWKRRKPVIDSVAIAFSKDVSDHGFRLLCVHPVEFQDAVVSLWPDPEAISYPFHFLTSVRASESVAPGIWSVGLMIEEYLNNKYHWELKELDNVARNALNLDDCACEELAAGTGGG